MTREQFIKATGEDPEDMFGPDWEAILEEFSPGSWGQEESHETFGGCVGVNPCWACRDGF